MPQWRWIALVAAGVVIDAAEAVAVDAEGLAKDGVGLGTAPRGTG